MSVRAIRASDRWVVRRAVVVGRTERPEPIEVKILAPESSDPSVVVAVGLTVSMIVVSLFVPLVLLLNIPLLIARAAMSQELASRGHRVRVDVVTCPDCAAVGEPYDQRGALPIEVTCAGCGGTLSIRQAPRVNLVETSFG